MEDITTIFKPYLQPKKVYTGGKNIPAATQRIFKLSSNENPLGASPMAISALKKAAGQLHRYPDQTDIRLREALARDFDHKLSADQFICGNSGSEIIDMIARAFLNVGDEAIYCNPSFLPYSVFSRWYGATPINVPLREKDYGLDINGILNAIGPNTKIIFLTSPNNPTGTYIPEPVLRDLLKRLPKNILVVYDEVYRHFAEVKDYTTGRAFVAEGFPLIAVNSFSKTYGLAGQRIGYCYSTASIANYLRQIHKPFLLPLTSIEAAIGALLDTDFLDRTIHTVKEGRAFLQTAFKSLELPFWPSQGNFILVDPPIPEIEFTDKLMAAGIMVRPMTQFGAPGKVRISVGTQRPTRPW